MSNLDPEMSSMLGENPFSSSSGSSTVEWKELMVDVKHVPIVVFGRNLTPAGC